MLSASLTGRWSTIGLVLELSRFPLAESGFKVLEGASSLQSFCRLLSVHTPSALLSFIRRLTVDDVFANAEDMMETSPGVAIGVRCSFPAACVSPFRLGVTLAALAVAFACGLPSGLLVLGGVVDIVVNGA